MLRAAYGVAPNQYQSKWRRHKMSAVNCAVDIQADRKSLGWVQGRLYMVSGCTHVANHQYYIPTSRQGQGKSPILYGGDASQSLVCSRSTTHRYTTFDCSYLLGPQVRHFFDEFLIEASKESSIDLHFKQRAISPLNSPTLLWPDVPRVGLASHAN